MCDPVSAAIAASVFVVGKAITTKAPTLPTPEPIKPPADTKGRESAEFTRTQSRQEDLRRATAAQGTTATGERGLATAAPANLQRKQLLGQ